ncbi:hypothetical protein NDN08_004090 [Rhodosorus marinus]|uniref:Oxysterol-binding protein n=1 Tax=Rhodosorus marinus TaxID=101924 RepID=A0AAV8UHB6_9RHOD|nr:hypothetical protein NDN08_004090 [Rhodosorus marinus]
MSLRSFDTKSFDASDDFRHSMGSSGGGVAITDGDMAERQKSFIARTLRTVGSKFFEGKPLTELSLHVSVFQPRSFLEKLVDDWDYGPYYLTKAAMEKNPLERVKLVAAFVIAGLHGSASLSKPFNPILGETYSAKWKDGTAVYLEQTNHHPPVTHWLVRHPENLYTFMGFGMFSGKVNMLENCVRTRRNGVNIVDFQDGGRVVILMPYMALRGLLFGERRVEFLGGLSIYDQANDIVADFALNVDPKFLGIFGGANSKPTDYFRGVVYKPSSTKFQKMDFSGLTAATGKKGSPYMNESLLDAKGLELRTDYDIVNTVKAVTKEADKRPSGLSRPNGLFRGASKSGSVSKGAAKAAPAKLKGTDGSRVLCVAQGTYLGYLDFDQERYWDIRDCPAERAQPDADDLLPTDARMRQDVQALQAVLDCSDTPEYKEEREKLFDKAQVVKEELEKRQRSDKKLREGPEKATIKNNGFFPNQLDLHS